MKKVICVLLSMTLVLSLAACSTLGQSTAGNQTAAEEYTGYGSTFYNLVDPDLVDESLTTPLSAEETPLAFTDPVQPSLTDLPAVSKDPYDDDYGLIIDGNRVMEQYGASETAALSYCRLINSFASKVPEGVNCYSMPIPLACGTYAPEGYEGSIRGHERAFQGLRENLEGITDVNLLPVFQEYKAQKLYSYTDHHWHALGAYHAAEALCEAAGVEFEGLGSYVRTVHNGYIGTLYRYVKHRAEFKDFTEDFITFEPRDEYTCHFYSQTMGDLGTRESLFFDVWDTYPTNWYGTYIGGDAYVADIISSTCHNGRKLLVIKDSYGNAMSPYFTYSFEETFFIDVRYFSANAIDLIEEYGITDVCFALCAFSIVGANGQNMANIM